MYCRQHDAVGCSTCMVMQHSACKDKVYVQDYIKDIKVENSSTVIEQLGTIASSLDKLQKTFLEKKSNLASRKYQLQDEIRIFCLEIHMKLDELGKNTAEDLDGIFLSLNDKIDATLKEIQAAIREVQSAKNNLNSAGNNASQLFVSVKMANNVAAHANKRITSTKHQGSSEDITFVPNQKLESLFNKAKSLGSISMPEGLQSFLQDPGCLPSVDTNKPNTASHVSQSSLPLLQVKKSKKYKVTQKTGTSQFQSVCELDDRTIVLSDLGQVRLFCIDISSYMVRDSCEVGLFPCQVCTISSQEVAVCCDKENLIQFVSTRPTMQTTRQIDIHHTHSFECSGLAYNNEKLFISDEYPSVHVYNLTGERLQLLNEPHYVDRILWDKNYSSTNIAVSSDGSRIYIVHSINGLIILDKNGRIVKKFNDSNLKHASGISLHKNNSVLVSGQDSKNVLQFTPSGKLIGEILKIEGSCDAVCFCKENSKLVVCIEDEIEVYDINE